MCRTGPVPGAGVASGLAGYVQHMSDTSDRIEELETHTDDGVPVGDADVQADVDRASGDRDEEPDTDDFLQQGAVEMSRDQGEAVGTADVEEDRRNAAGESG